MYHDWLKLISKYESPNSEKIASSIKITLALQNVRGPLANALSFSINDKSTWNDIHELLINYFNNNNSPADTKEIYQVDISGKVSKEDSVNQLGQKGKGKSKKSKGQSKGKGPSQNQSQNKGKGKSKSSKEMTKSKGKDQRTTWRRNQPWSWNQGRGGKGKGKGHQALSHCGHKGHSVDQRWWAPKTSSAGSRSDRKR